MLNAGMLTSEACILFNSLDDTSHCLDNPVQAIITGKTPKDKQPNNRECLRSIYACVAVSVERPAGPVS